MFARHMRAGGPRVEAAWERSLAVCPELKRVLLSPHMSETTRHYNFADLFELAADKVPDRVAHRRQAPRGDVPRARRALDPLRPRAPGRGREAGRPRRHPRHQLHRVGRGDVRRLQDARPRRERELPLRRGGAALPLRQLRHGRARVPARVRPDRDRQARDAQPKLQHFFRIEWDGSDADDCGARPRRVRGGDRVGLARARLRRALGRRRLPALHGRHDRHAEGRDVAPGRRVLRARRRHRRDLQRAGDVAVRREREDRPVAARGRPVPADPAAHARRRAVLGPPRRCSRATRVVHRRQVRRRGRVAARRPAQGQRASASPATRWRARSPTRSRS